MKRWTLTVCMTLNICALLAIDYFLPSLTVPFQSQSDRVLDLISGAFCSCLGLVMIMWVVISSYDRERERTEKYARDLANQHGRLAVTIAAIPDLLFELDADGRICEYHTSIAESLYAPPGTFLGKTVEQVLPPDAAAVILNALARAASSGLDRGASYALDMHGSRHWYELSIAVKPEGSAPDTRFVALIRDITERKRAEAETLLLREELALFSRAATVGELTASIAHDLNQPLAAILSNAQSAMQLMQGGSPDLKELHEILEDIAADDTRAAGIIRSVRSMLKRGEGERCPVLLNDLITEVLSLVRNDAFERKVAIIRELGSVLPPIEGNRVQLQQVILNLVMNAFEAMEMSESRELVLRTRQAEGKIMLDVIDSGPGIPPDKLGSIFEPFFTTKTSGLGLGLALSRSIALAHNGRLWADNNMQRGATFHLALPTVDAPISKKTGLKKREFLSSIHPASTRKIKVLLADDDAAARQRSAILLENQPDIEVIGSATNGQETIELAAKMSPDIILMDIDMPKLNGIEATQTITNDYPNICIIGWSMFEQNERGRAMLNAGATKYLTKNCPSTELIDAIRECMVEREDENES
jgi:PAS domain S-box-containing protein